MREEADINFSCKTLSTQRGILLRYIITSFHATVLLLYPMKALENL